MNNSRTWMKMFLQHYSFLSCRNELLSLAIVLTYYDSKENSCGEKFHSASSREKFLAALVLLVQNTKLFGAIISPYLFVFMYI